MKNIYVLPTDKPTRLFTSDSELILTGYPVTTFKTGKHIYITSDEEIKIKDYVINLEDNEIYPSMGCMGNNNWIKKIILTTDQDLINDGVQAIDDEFLEWFVKNPSCNRVHIGGILKEGSNNGYEIILLKETPEQHVELINNNIEEFDKAIELFRQRKSKQETLEEAAEKHARIMWGVYYDDKHPDIAIIQTQGETSIKDFIAGVKWQQERSYSEEDLRTAFFNGVKVTGEGYNAEFAMGNNPNVESVFDEDYNKWFEQFKKK